MSKRHKPPVVRLNADGTHSVMVLANGTGWPFNKALAFIVRAGWNVLDNGSDEIPAMRQVMANAVAHRETELAMKKRLAVTARKLREAQSALTGKSGGAP
jgi:hypothetical protein